MSSRPARVRAVSVTTALAEDRRLAVMRALVIDAWLPGEWDPVRYLLVPSQDGLLARRRECSVPSCPGNVNNSTDELCTFHARQFALDPTPTVQDWIASGAPRAVRRNLALERCSVDDGQGNRCPRPCWQPGLCIAHDRIWAIQRNRGSSRQAFLAEARPLSALGDCIAGSCYLLAAHEIGLCELHYQLWIDAGRPNGASFDDWRSRVRQPTSRLTLSLRGLPELVRLEVLYALQRRVGEKVRTTPEAISTFVDELRSSGVRSVLDFDRVSFDRKHNSDKGRLARFTLDRVALAYRDPETEVTGDRWDMRVFSRSGELDFTPIRQGWLREGVKKWAAATMARTKTPSLRARVQATFLLSQVLASGKGGGHDPSALSRRDIDRFLLRLPSLRSPSTGEPFSPQSLFTITASCRVVLQEAAAMGFLPGLSPTFSFRRGDAHARFPELEEGRAIPPHVVAQLDAHLDLLRAFPGTEHTSHVRTLGVLGERAGDVVVLAYLLLKGTGRRLGEIASLHLDCLGADEHDKPVLFYDNHKAGRMRRRLPLADSALVEAIRDQQRWVAQRFPGARASDLWLFPRPNKNVDGAAHISGSLLSGWMRAWVKAIPRIDANPADAAGEGVPFDRSAITPRAFRPTYAQTLADQGVPPSVLRDLMDHKSMNTTLGYYRVNEAKKRQAMELVARHTVDNRGTLRPAEERPSRAAELREELSWVAVPMGKCSEPTNVRAGGQACPIRYQCAGCPHFESDPSYLPELRSYADDLRREKEILLAFGAADWVVENVARQLDVIVEHVRRHEQLLGGLADGQRVAIEDASRTVRKARQSVPVVFGRRRVEAAGG